MCAALDSGSGSQLHNSQSKRPSPPTHPSCNRQQRPRGLTRGRRTSASPQHQLASMDRHQATLSEQYGDAASAARSSHKCPIHSTRCICNLFVLVHDCKAFGSSFRVPTRHRGKARRFRTPSAPLCGFVATVPDHNSRNTCPSRTTSSRRSPCRTTGQPDDTPQTRTCDCKSRARRDDPHRAPLSDPRRAERYFVLELACQSTYSNKESNPPSRRIGRHRCRTCRAVCCKRAAP